MISPLVTHLFFHVSADTAQYIYNDLLSHRKVSRVPFNLYREDDPDAHLVIKVPLLVPLDCSSDRFRPLRDALAERQVEFVVTNVTPPVMSETPILLIAEAAVNNPSDMRLFDSLGVKTSGACELGDFDSSTSVGCIEFANKARVYLSDYLLQTSLGSDPSILDLI